MTDKESKELVAGPSIKRKKIPHGHKTPASEIKLGKINKLKYSIIDAFQQGNFGKGWVIYRIIRLIIKLKKTFYTKVNLLLEL